MKPRRISQCDIVPGAPLQWDVFDSEQQLLHAKGSTLDDSQQIMELVQRGAWAEAPPLSVLRTINDAHRRLERLLFNLEREPDAAAQILEVATDLMRAVDANADIALACILLNQDEGSYAVRHCIDSAIVALLVARALEKRHSESLSIMAAALTMNIGMLQNQEQLQGRLNAISGQEVALIQAHPEESVRILERAGVNDHDWLQSVLLHHENEDGSGYPFGRQGETIPLAAKIVSLADRYCARVSSRGYRRALLPNDALNDMLVADQRSIDPMLTACFIRVLGIYPTGALVRLANGEIGVVARQVDLPGAPLVQAIVGANGARMSPPQQRDTSVPDFSVREILSAQQAGLRFSMQQIWGEQAVP